MPPMYAESQIKDAEKKALLYESYVEQVSNRELKKLFRERAEKWRSILQEMVDANAKQRDGE